MADQASLFGTAGRTDSAEVLADLEVDYTPPAVAVQMLLSLVDVFPSLLRARTVLDPAAGSGVWGRAVRAVYDHARAAHEGIVERQSQPLIFGADARASEIFNLEAAYDVGRIFDFDDLCDAWLEDLLDLVITNPPFSAFERGWWLTLRDSGMLAERGVVALLGLSQWGQSEGAAALLREWSPVLQIRAGGRIAYRGSGKADSRDYSLWVWAMDHGAPAGFRRRSWTVEQLPVLPPELRRWDSAAIPGTYPIDQALVERVRSAYL